MSRLVIGRKKYWQSATKAISAARGLLEERGHDVEFETNGSGMRVARCRNCLYLTIVCKGRDGRPAPYRYPSSWFVFGRALDEECPRTWG